MLPIKLQLVLRILQPEAQRMIHVSMQQQINRQLNDWNLSIAYRAFV